MALTTTPVPNCLEKKLTFLGYEVMDLMLIFGTLSILNFTLGAIDKLTFVWMPTVLLAITLRSGKRGKPDKYLEHKIRFHAQPKNLSAFERTQVPVPPMWAGRSVWPR
jgi:hypothetical protein